MHHNLSLPVNSLLILRLIHRHYGCVTLIIRAVNPKSCCEPNHEPISNVPTWAKIGPLLMTECPPTAPFPWWGGMVWWRKRGVVDLSTSKRLVEIQWRSSLHILLSSSPPLAAGAIPRIPAFQRSVRGETEGSELRPQPALQETHST